MVPSDSASSMPMPCSEQLSRLALWQSALRAHPCDNAAHISETLSHSGKGIVLVHFVFEHHAAPIVHLGKLAEDGSYRHLSFSHRRLFAGVGQIARVFDMHIEQSRSRFAD